MKKFYYVLSSFIMFCHFGITSFAQTCNVQNWDYQKVYEANQQAKYNGIVYQSKWWVQGQVPTNDPYGPWQFLEICPEVIDPSTCLGIPSWNNAQIYNGGEIIRYQNSKYKANYYSISSIPNLNFGLSQNEGKPWVLLGQCDIPNITKIGTLSDFKTSVGERSTAQKLTVAAANLNTVLQIQMPANFEIAISPTGNWSSSLTLNPTPTGVLPTEIWISYNPNGLGTHKGDVVISSQNATTLEIPVLGIAEKFTHVVCNSKTEWNASTTYLTGQEVIYNGKLFVANWWNQGKTPNETTLYGEWSVKSQCVFTSISVSNTTFLPFTTLLGTPSATQTTTLVSSDIFDDVQLVAPNHFEISQNPSGPFVSLLKLSPQNNTINTSIYVRYNPFFAGNHEGILSISTKGLAQTAITLKGSSSAIWLQTSPTQASLNSNITELNIGAGAMPKGYKMAVNGKILTKGLKVQADGWADFVFDSAYQLLPLESVEKFIQKEKHLPAVPAQSEIIEEGIDMETMLRLQMQKIEELTLYLIELDKQNKKLADKINLLESHE